jgi:peptidoglycan/LPS O-acetylase OafA/YrhL
MTSGPSVAVLDPGGSRSERPARAGVEPAGARDTRRTAGFRPDIEGLRAIAVVLVVVSHAGFTPLAGGYVGVDVFFVISGFLITSLLLKEVAVRGTVSLSRFYARRVARLLPAYTLVVMVTLGASWWWLRLRAPSIGVDALASAYYGLNLRLAELGTNYLSATAPPSPLQHLWSLAVEEQFYLVWPLLLLGSALVWRRWPKAGRALTVAALVALSIISLATSVWLTGRSAPWGFFGTPSRVWELAVGALVAFAAPAAARAPRRWLSATGWIGLAAVVASAVAFDDSTAFPGYAALLPVTGAALLLLGGCADAVLGATGQPVSTGVGRLLGSVPFQIIGRRSYSWYLWHWPILIIAPAVLGRPVSPWQTVAIVGSSFGLAAASYAWVENPIRTSAQSTGRPLRTLIGIGAGLSAATATLALVVVRVPAPLVGPGPAAASPALVVAAADADPMRRLSELIASSATTREVPSNLTPNLRAVSADLPAVYADGCQLSAEATEITRTCAYGDLTSATNVVLFGDSHAAGWFPALNTIARQRHWRLVVLLKGSCSPASTPVFHTTLKRPYTECDRWRENALVFIGTLRPAMVVMASKQFGRPLDGTVQPDEAWAAGWRTTTSRLRTTTTRTVVINETPRLERDVLDCVSTHLADYRPCNSGRAQAIVDSERRQLIAEVVTREGATVIDPIPWFCDSRSCPAIIGNIVVYRDSSHISAAYAALLAPALDRLLP